jgi:hypothetical protein
MAVARSVWLSCFGALVAAAVAAAPARADQLVGVVKSVDTQGRKFVVVEKTTDALVDVSVTPATSLATRAGRLISLKRLKKGDGVGIALFNGVATSVVVNQSPVAGVVENMDLDGKELVIDEVVDEKRTGRDVRVLIPEQATIETTGGKVYRLKDLKSGDGVSMVYDGDEVAKVIVNVKPTELTGHVKSVAADLKSFVINEIGSKEEVKVAVTPDTVIVTGSGKTMDLKDLKKGDGVGIAHEASVASRIVVNPAPVR